MFKTIINITTQFLLAVLLLIISAAGVFGEAFERNNESSDAWRFFFSGADSSLNATADHPFWSDDRQAYVPIGKLQPGEKVKTRQGVVEFISKTKIPGSLKVYNLEVYREHNYFVTEAGLLAHNCGEASNIIPNIPEGGILRIQNAANRINQPIHIVGSRANGTATILSDFDYCIPAIKRSSWNMIKNSLPGAKSTIEGLPNRIDMFRDPLIKELPYFTIYPR